MARALEYGMFHKMGKSLPVGRLVTTAGIDHRADIRHVALCLDSHYPQSVGKSVNMILFTILDNHTILQS